MSARSAAVFLPSASLWPRGAEAIPAGFHRADSPRSRGVPGHAECWTSAPRKAHRPVWAGKRPQLPCLTRPGSPQTGARTRAQAGQRLGARLGLRHPQRLRKHCAPVRSLAHGTRKVFSVSMQLGASQLKRINPGTIVAVGHTDRLGSGRDCQGSRVGNRASSGPGSLERSSGNLAA